MNIGEFEGITRLVKCPCCGNDADKLYLQCLNGDVLLIECDCGVLFKVTYAVEVVAIGSKDLPEVK